MTNTAEQTVIAGSGEAYVAPWSDSLTLPTLPPTYLGLNESGDPSNLDAAFIHLGYIQEDGATLSLERDTQTVGAWQSKRSIRRYNVSQMERITLQLLQWNGDTIILAFGGGELVSAGPGARYNFPDPNEVDDRAMVLDFGDDDKLYRLVIPKGNVGDTAESQFHKGGVSVLPITFEAVDQEPYILTNDPAMIEAIS
jgi:hypothetical protein